MDSQPVVFVSYRRSKLASVQAVVVALENAGVRCFLDVETIDPLADFPTRICDAIDRSHAILVWWSHDYGDSDFCLQELRRAWGHARRRSSDIARRLWVVNPEATAHHIFAGEVDSENFLKAPSAGDEAWIALLVQRLRDLLPEGPLADERRAEPVPTFHHVAEKSSQFTGRNRELMRVHSKLHPVRIGAQGTSVAVQLHGMGGVGKTQLATTYARDFSMAYPGGIYWLNLATLQPNRKACEDEAQSAWLRAVEQTLQLSPELIQRLLRDAEGKALSPHIARERFAKHLGNEAEYLWILDNVPELSPLDVRARILDFIRAPTSTGRTLLTTRDGRRADGFVQESLEVLSEEEALRLLAQFRLQNARAELDAMREIVVAVGAHTQALILLGEYARNEPGGYPSLAQQIIETGRLNQIESIAKEFKDLLGDKARGIIATFRLSIKALSATQRELLSLSAVCLSNVPIPDTLLLAAFGRETGFGTALGELLRRSLLSRREATTTHVFIHPLIADVTLRLLKANVAALRERLADALLSRLTNVDIRTLASLAHDVEQARGLGGVLEDELAVALLLRVGRFEHTRGRYADAKISEMRALSLAVRVLGEEDLQTLTLMNNLAATLWAQGDFRGARALHERALSLSQRVLGEEHPDTLTSMNNLAETLRTQGDLKGARALQERVLSLSQRVLGKEHSDTLTAMSNLANTLSAQGDFNGAWALDEQVLSLRQHVLGEEHPYTLTAMSNLASTLSARGDLNGARTLQERALSLSQRVLGEEHPYTLTAMDNLASTLSAQGDLNGARALQERALRLVQRVLGQEHPETLTLMGNLAETLRAQGDLGDALALQERVLSLRRRTLGEEHPDTLTSITNLAATLTTQGDLSSARTSQETGLSLQQRVLGVEHPNTLKSMNNLARILSEQGDLSGARELQERALSLQQRAQGEEHPDTLMSMSNLALMMREQGDLSGARALQERLLSLRQRVLGKEHPDTSVSAWNLFVTASELDESELASATFSNHLLWLLGQEPSGLNTDQNHIRNQLIEFQQRSD